MGWGSAPRCHAGGGKGEAWRRGVLPPVSCFRFSCLTLCLQNGELADAGGMAGLGRLRQGCPFVDLARSKGSAKSASGLESELDWMIYAEAPFRGTIVRESMECITFCHYLSEKLVFDLLLGRTISEALNQADPRLGKQ